MNTANRITITRIMLIPLVVLFILVDFAWGKIEVTQEIILSVTQIIGTLLFILASSTDGLDGYYARKHNQVTNLGKFLDPLADKLLISAALIALVETGDVPSWMVIVILAREFAITGLRGMAAITGKVIAASKWGKVKTVTQIVAVSALILDNFPFSLIGIPFDQLMLWIALVMTIISGVDYLVKNKDVIRE
ncbi:CDP-diacylglycerol--glycerol-3-phosphate 3-phosphatidyltransferase [Rubeoparvulum massiliense]|uniref:CDP-diacylglycerol--glycerol-3-phosphate 3-phosphatidyltransferase n=1 Tax=Rubeoparvulum massiliense TaxID=1631346 RepID=UPI00065DFE28|nr:CDP-diacylglycerol--glycerol-3-phosphate 3-phosphatidyltransferase [Rubeoparvulum massiliense]